MFVAGCLAFTIPICAGIVWIFLDATKTTLDIYTEEIED